MSWKEKPLNIKSVIVLGCETDLLACYLSGQLETTTADFLIIENNVWTEFSNSPQHKAKRDENKISYVWDNLIEMAAKKYDTTCVISEFVSSNLEEGLRAMDLEDRYFRRNLSKYYLDFLENAKLGKTRSRLFYCPQCETGYVWLCGTKNDTREIRCNELFLRCIASIAHLPNEIKTIVGISSNTPEQVPSEGSAFEFITLKITKDNLQELTKIAFKVKKTTVLIKLRFLGNLIMNIPLLNRNYRINLWCPSNTYLHLLMALFPNGLVFRQAESRKARSVSARAKYLRARYNSKKRRRVRFAGRHRRNNRLADRVPHRQETLFHYACCKKMLPIDFNVASGGHCLFEDVTVWGGHRGVMDFLIEGVNVLVKEP